MFTCDVNLGLQAQRAGVYSVIVDWERAGKYERQCEHPFEINVDGPEEVSLLAECLNCPVTVRINSLGPYTQQEIEQALTLGAGIVMLPMATHPSEVERFVRMVRGRAKTLIQIETQNLATYCEALRDIEWDFVHIGLNDLSISRNSNWLWEPLYDGTVEHICSTLKGRAYGFGGATIVGGGQPIPFIHLLREMARLKCGMGILRRTFKREIVGRDMRAELNALHAFYDAALSRKQEAVDEDHQALIRVLSEVYPTVIECA